MDKEPQSKIPWSGNKVENGIPKQSKKEICLGEGSLSMNKVRC